MTRMKRLWFAVVINAIIPGTGLIVLRREWLGLALSVLFGVLAQTVILGSLIVPLDVPGWAFAGAQVGMVGVWALSQGLVIARGRQIVSPELEGELRRLCERARDAMARQNLEEAHRALFLAQSVNDEDLEAAVLRAELMSLTGRTREARYWWHRVLALDHARRHRRVALDALASLRA